MVGAFPEAGAVIGGVGGAIGAEAPVPFSVGGDYMGADEGPFSVSGFKPMRITSLLVLVDAANDCLGLNPPMAVGISVAGGGVIFIDHSSFGGETFHCGGSNLRAD